MNIFTSLLGSFGAKKSVEPSFTGESWFPVSGSDRTISEANLLEANTEWVFVAVDKIATSLAGVRFKVMRYARNGDDQELFKGPLVEFLESPSDGLTGKDFIYLNTAWKELTGNAFWEKVGGGKIDPLIPTRVSPILDKGKVRGFKYSDGATQRTILAKNLLHDRYADPAKPYWGVSKLKKIARWVDTSSLTVELLQRFFANGATFGGFIETEEESELRIKLIKAGLQNDHVGVANAHKIGVLPKGSKYAKGTANMAEMEMGATDDRYRDKILAAFGVPKTLVGLTTEVNRASAEASEYIYAKYTIKPIADDLKEFLNNSIAPLLDTTGQSYFDFDEFIPENAELKLKEREIALAKQPYMTVNEVRASAGLPPVQGGDTVYGSPALAPLGSPAPAPAPAPAEEEEKEPKKAIPSRARAAFKRDDLIEGIVSKAMEIATAQLDPDADSHKAFVGRVEGYESSIADRVRMFNSEQERDIQLRLKSITKSVKSSDLFDFDQGVTVLVDFVSPLLKGLMIEQAVEEYFAQSFPGTLDQAAPSLSKIVATAARRVARSYNRTTADLLAKTLNDGISQGEALSDLSARVRQVYEFSDKVRAAAVARTEAYYIANEGSREAFRQSGVVKTMRWYTGEDERVCPFCGPQNGKVIGVNETFYNKGDVLTGEGGKELKLDYRAIDVPPLHTNCRCFIRPEQIGVS